MTGMPTVVLLAIWEGKEDKRGTFVGFQHGALLSFILGGTEGSGGRQSSLTRKAKMPTAMSSHRSVLSISSRPWQTLGLEAWLVTAWTGLDNPMMPERVVARSESTDT